MKRLHINCKECWKSWRAGVSLRKDRKSRITGGVYAAAYLGLAAAAIWFNGWSPWPLLLILLTGAVGLSVYLIKAPVHWILRLAAGLAIPALVFVLLESYTHELTTFEGNAVRLNLILYYLIYLLLFFLTGRVWLTCTVATVILMICGIANYFVLLFRSAPIVPWDFYSLGTAMSVAGNQQFEFDYRFAVISCMFLTLILISLRLGLHLKLHVLRGLFAAVTAAAAGWMAAYLMNPDTPEKEGLDDGLWVATNTYKKDGFVLAFTMNLRYLKISAPDGYDKEQVEELLASYREEEEPPEELPNIIVIMSETFSDPAVLGSFETNMDYMPFIHSLLEGEENTISGHVYVSVLGGNTANSEFEFLTGNSMKFFPIGSVPYQQYIHEDVDSVVSEITELGYTALAMHPYRAGGWNRNKVYPFMGFDRMLFISDLTYQTKLRNYVSDESDYMNVLEQLEAYEEPVFIHNVTMQNHSAYGGTYDNFTPLIAAEFKNTKSNKYLDNYLSLMYETDQATEQLIQELEESEEPTIVCFFGDHQPNDYVIKPVYREHGLDIENQTLEQQQKRQITPFFIWANFDIEEQTDVEISSNYLCNLLLKAAGIPLDEYRTYLESVREVLPVMNTVGYFNRSGVLKSYNGMTDEEQEVLDTYEKVQYYHMFDR